MTDNNTELLIDAVRERVITAVAANLRKLDVETIKAFHVLVEWRVKQNAKPWAPKVGRTLLRQLRAVHACQKEQSTGAGFVQLEGGRGHRREWQCQGCGAFVELPRGR